MASKETVEVTIARGTYVTEAGSFGPGKTVKVSAEEAARLKSDGTVQPDDYIAPEEVQDGKVTVKTKDGTKVVQQ
jgi:hypothetical protein